MSKPLCFEVKFTIEFWPKTRMLLKCDDIFFAQCHFQLSIRMLEDPHRLGKLTWQAWSFKNVGPKLYMV